jgi:serine/threonine protein kinase
MGVVHFDIKAANFIFTSHADTRVSERSQAILRSHKEGKPAGILQVIDFGEALLTSTPSKLDRSRGTLAVLSPEMLALNTANGEVVIPSYSSDIWSLGCLLVEVILGHFLYQDVPWPEMYVTLCMLNQEQSNTQYRPINDGILSELKALIPAEYVGFIENILVKILQQTPAARPTISGIISDVSQLITRLDLDTPVTTTVIPAASASPPASTAVKETLVMLHNKIVIITETAARFDDFFLCVTSTNPLEKNKKKQGFYALNEGIGGTPSDSDNTCDHINNEVFNVIFNASLARFNQILLEKQIFNKKKYHVIHIGSECVSSKQGSSEEVTQHSSTHSSTHSLTHSSTQESGEEMTQHSIYLSVDPLQLRQNYQRILQAVKGNNNIIIILYPSSKPDSFSALAVTLLVAFMEELSGTTESYHHGVRSTVPVLYDSHNKMVGTYLNMA